MVFWICTFKLKLSVGKEPAIYVSCAFFPVHSLTMKYEHGTVIEK